MDLQALTKDTFEMIQYKIKDVLLNILYETVDLYAFPQEGAIEGAEFPLELIKLKSELKDYIKAIPQELKKNCEERLPFLEKLGDYRNRVAESYYKGSLYLSRLSMYDDMYTFSIRKEAVKDIEKDVRLDDFKEYLEHLAEEIENMGEMGSYMMGTLLSLFPLRMSKSKYADYVKRGLTELFEGENSDFISSYLNLMKTRINPAALKGYGESSWPIKECIEQLENTNINELDIEGLTEKSVFIENSREDMGDIIECYDVLYNIVTYMDAFLRYCIDEEFVFEGDLKFKDLMYATVELLDSPEPEVMGETLEENIENMIEELYNKYTDKEKKLNKKLDKLKEKDMPEELETSVNVYTTLESTFIVEVADELPGISDDNKEITAEQAIEQILDYIDKNIGSYPLPQQKFVKKAFLSSIPSYFDAEEAYEYMAYSLDGIKDKATLLVCMGDVLELTDPGDDEDEHHHHHHDHDHCGCDHDHDHDHH